MSLQDDDARAEAEIRENFFNAVMALGPFISEQCGAVANVRIVLDEDLATNFCDCEDNENWQLFSYALSRLTIDGELVCIEFGTPYYPLDWMFRHDVDPALAQFQINVHNMIQHGVAESTIATVEHVLHE